MDTPIVATHTPIEVFDFSMLNLFRQCPRKFEERMLHHLVPINREEYVQAFGSAGHAGLAAWYETGSATLMDKAFMDTWMPFEGQDKKGVRTMVRGLTIMRQYREKYPREREPFAFTSPKYIEVGFAVELGDFIYCGKMDGAPRWHLGFEGFIVLENKFSGSKGYLTTNPNHQIDGYIWGVSQLTGETAVGAYFNQIYHTGKALDGNDFVRELTRRSQEDLDDWERNTLVWMKNVNTCIKKGFFPKNTNSCGAFWRACEYTMLCTCSDPTQRQLYRDTLYRQEMWNPYPDARSTKTEKEKEKPDGSRGPLPNVTDNDGGVAEGSSRNSDQ